MFRVDDSTVEMDGLLNRGRGWRGPHPEFEPPTPGSPVEFMGATYRAVPDGFTVIPRIQWRDMIRARKPHHGLRAIGQQAGLKIKDQKQEPLCWAYASVKALEYVRAKEGLPYVELAPESAAGPVTGWKQRGGYTEEILGQLMKGGACASSFMDAPNSFSPKLWKAGWQEDALRHQIEYGEFWYARNIDEQITLLLNDLPVSAGLAWWGHQVCMVEAILDSGEVSVSFDNSWGDDWGDKGTGILSLKKAESSSAFAPRFVTPNEK
jgi:hypothetical protein